MWAVVVARLVQIQGLEHDAYAAQARSQHERQIPLSARRGPILDQDGRTLAFDVASVSFYCRPALVRDADAVANHFARFSRRSPGAVRQLLDGEHPFVYLLRQADDSQLEGVRAHDFKGVYEQEEVRRYYPYGRLAGQLLGFTDVDNKGREGVELAFDEALAEQAGSASSCVDSRGRILPSRSKATEPARHGASVRLTIDAVAQGILEEELARTVAETEAESALGIITDPRTGEVLALATVPLFDPNDPGAVPAAHRRNRLLTDPFEPGSTFKPITMAAVLEANASLADTSVFCEQGAYQLATGDTIRDVEAHGWLTASQVMARSSNIGMIKLARTLERADFYQQLRGFGFGTRTSLDLPAESAGLLHHAKDWSERSLETIAIGQEVSVTAVQLVQAFGAIANGGSLMAPRVVAEVRDADDRLVRRTEPQRLRRVLRPETAGILNAMMRGVVRDGTGRRAQIAGVAVAGKTGTAQRALPDGAGYAEDEYVSSFVGFLPAIGTPRYLCLVVVENPRLGKYGGTVAAPAFQRTMERILALEGATVPAAAPVAGLQTSPAQAIAPDFRGLNVDGARRHAERRGLTVLFEGRGSFVVDQDPSPRATQANTVVLCRLGAPADAFAVALPAMPLRQAALLRKLGAQRQLMAWAH